MSNLLPSAETSTENSTTADVLPSASHDHKPMLAAASLSPDTIQEPDETSNNTVQAGQVSKEPVKKFDPWGSKFYTVDEMLKLPSRHTKFKRIVVHHEDLENPRKLMKFLRSISVAFPLFIETTGRPY